jgi:hypothetical protein
MELELAEIREKTFLVNQVHDITGIDKQNLKELTNRRIIEPKIPSGGKGVSAQFSRYNLYQIAIFMKLRKMEISRKIISQIIGVLLKENECPESLGYLVYKVVNKEGMIHYKPLLISRNQNVEIKSIIKDEEITIECGDERAIEFNINDAKEDDKYELEYFSVVNLTSIGKEIDTKIRAAMGELEIEKSPGPHNN